MNVKFIFSPGPDTKDDSVYSVDEDSSDDSIDPFGGVHLDQDTDDSKPKRGKSLSL